MMDPGEMLLVQIGTEWNFVPEGASLVLTGGRWRHRGGIMSSGSDDDDDRALAIWSWKDGQFREWEPPQQQENPVRTPFEIYGELDLGPGGYAIAPSTETRSGVLTALRRKRAR